MLKKRRGFVRAQSSARFSPVAESVGNSYGAGFPFLAGTAAGLKTCFSCLAFILLPASAAVTYLKIKLEELEIQ